MQNDISLITLLAVVSLVPFLICAGTCYIKFSIVFVIVRNALGLQQVPSNMTLNGIALIMACYVMFPIAQSTFEKSQEMNINYQNVDSVREFLDYGLSDYKSYLRKFSDPELIVFFESRGQEVKVSGDTDVSITSLLPAYALSEIKTAFIIGFYIYLPFIVVDLVISSILLSLGMMMMSPVTISTPIKLILFVSLDGWTILSKGLINQYLSSVS
ncbi:EscR/YscR/HrcR family type III secretion system export apparatus protein [Escherichia coli]|uniref:EscR/YscR/HrcR family type III secretion system export apparatus protein n=1 Tax=Escherichia coli TaxID=562 RepID=UPI00142BA5CD|nr:EscR/YscR/HrcR family type III secretion system export apparatus protein [Escherichia coli]EFB1451831.1 EscR/YscR/HrcR family type III secretion system export apparatus protein [Escherichia coli]EFO2135278.1 EscR/YscR/HrcR family type III secretion system export apparatus protein [Escherichia coli]KAB3085876.1 EscR/YscR/HrcR family type III secretion system export apparatus protein [Escherichia coli]